MDHFRKLGVRGPVKNIINIFLGEFFFKKRLRIRVEWRICKILLYCLFAQVCWQIKMYED